MMKNFKHFTKRTLALLLALVMCVGLLQLTAFAEDGDASAEPVTGDSAAVPDGTATDADDVDGTDGIGLEETESEDEGIMPLAEEDETEGETVLVKWLQNWPNYDTTLLHEEVAVLGADGIPTNTWSEIPEVKNYMFVGWDLVEKEKVYDKELGQSVETGNWVIRAQWLRDQDVDPLVPESERPSYAWGDGIPDLYQIKIYYIMLNGTFDFNGETGLRSGVNTRLGGYGEYATVASTVVTKRNADGVPSTDGTAYFADVNIPTNFTPDTGYTTLVWVNHETHESCAAPQVGAEAVREEGTSDIKYVAAFTDPSTKVTVKYYDKDRLTYQETVIKGSPFYPWQTRGLDDKSYGSGNGRLGIVHWKGSDGKKYGQSWVGDQVYSLAQDLRMDGEYTSYAGLSFGTAAPITVEYQWGDVTPSSVALPGKLGFYKNANVPVQPGPTGSVKVGSDEYVFLGWKVTSGSIQNQPKDSECVGATIKLNREDVVLTAQWVKKAPPKVLVIWKSGGEDNVTLKAENVPAEKITEENGKVTKVDAVYPDTPTRDGYSFNGWTIEKQPDGSIVITAQWTTCNHDWRQTTPPTCEGKGEETCSKCGETREIPATGHAYPDEWTVTKPATCEGKGEKVKVCGNDKNHVLKEDIEPIGHDWEIKDEGDAGHSWVCKNDPEHTKPVEPHNYPDEWTVTKQPTDTEPGEKEKVCEDCGHKHTEEIPATKPEKVNVTYQDPDGEEIGKDTPDKGTEYEVKGLPDGVTPPEGKEFDKWQGSDGNEYKPGDKITPDGDLTLTVVWKDKPEEKPEEPETPVPVVPEIVVTPKPSEDPAPSEDPGEEIIDPSEPPLGELPTEPSEAPEPSEPAETDPAESEDLSEEIIDPSEPPLGELPEDLAKPGEPADTDQPGDSFAPGEEPGEDISDGQPPMGNVPEEPGEDISDNRPPMSDAPVSDVPQTGEASNVIWLAATLLAGAGLVVVNTGKRKEERK